MFSAKLERRRQFKRLALLAAAATFAAGIGAIVFVALRASTLLEDEAAGRAMPIALLVVAALIALLVVCLVVYALVRIAGRAQL